MATKDEAFPKGTTSQFSFDYDGVVLTRRSGQATCEEMSHGGFLGMDSVPQCAFSSPGALAVTRGQRTYYFLPEIGRSVTIAFGDGPPRCVVGPGLSVLSKDALSAN